MATNQSSLNLELQYWWELVTVAPDVPYAFPSAASRKWLRLWNGPAIYRWLITDGGTKDEVGIYIGETDMFARRLYQYVKPGLKQQTNLRLNAALHDYLAQGCNVSLEILRLNKFQIGTFSISAEHLIDKSVRCLLENLFAVQYASEGRNLLNACAAKSVQEP